MNITHAPVVSMASPTDGAIFRGTLNVRATVTDDQPGTTVRAWLGDVEIFQTTDSSIDRNHSLANVTPGQYTLRLQARDAGGIVTVIERAVIVTAVTAFSYEYAGDSSSPVTLLDTEGSQLLYRAPVGPVHRRSVGGSDVSLLNSADITGPSESPLLPSLWQVSGGHVSTTGWIGSGTPSVFLWDPSGAHSALPYTLQTGEFRGFLRSALHGSWLVWGSGRIYLRNLSAPSADIGPIQGDMLRGHAFANTAGNEKLYFARTTGQVGSSGILDLFVYDVAAGTTTLLTGGDAVHARPQTDATRVAWEKRGLLANINQPPFELVVAPVSNPTATVVRSTTATKFVLDDGILAWTETASNATALKVDDGSSQTTVSHTTSTVLYSSSDGSVVFSESGKLYIWSAAQGRRLLLEVLPKELVQEDHDIYLTVGGQGVTIHRTTY